MYTVGQLARLFGLSRSTLLYYDEIGLLSPSARSAANYRLYSEEDAGKMERIKIYREAGLSLEAIRSLLCEGNDSLPVLLEQHLQALSQKISRLRQQQLLIGELLGNPQVLQGSRSLTKAQWVSLLASSGMTRDEMWKWHAEFERNFPEAHQDFLESLGITGKEITMIRKHSAEKIKTGYKHIKKVHIDTD